MTKKKCSWYKVKEEKRKKQNKTKTCSFKMQYGTLDWILEQKKDMSG